MKKTVFILGCLSVLALTACQKEVSDNFTLYTNHPLNDTTWARNVSASASVNGLTGLLSAEITLDSCRVTGDTTLTYGDSLEITLARGAFFSPVGGIGTTISGNVKLEILRLKTKGDYIKSFRPTTSNGYLLESAGAFYVRISKDGIELPLNFAAAPLKIRFIDTENPKTNMQVFYGREDNPIPEKGIDTAFTWLTTGNPADTAVNVKIFQKQSSAGKLLNGYELGSRKSRWIAAARFADSTKPKARITAILPLNYTNKNTAVFAVFADQKTVVNLRGDYPSRSFAAPNIPLGSKLKLVTISKIGSDLYLGTKDVNDVGSVTAYSVKPEKESLKEILAFLNSL